MVYVLENRLCSIASIEHIEELYGLPPESVWHEKPGRSPINDHFHLTRGPLSTALVGILNAVLDALPNVPPPFRPYLLPLTVARRVDPQSYIELWSGDSRAVLTAAQWEGRSGHAHLADLVEGHWEISNPAWMP